MERELNDAVHILSGHQPELCDEIRLERDHLRRELAQRPADNNLTKRPMSSSRLSTRRFIKAVLTECSEKHALHPFEDNLSPGYQIELTFTIQEIRELLIENGDCWDWRKFFDSGNTQAQAAPAQTSTETHDAKS